MSPSLVSACQRVDSDLQSTGLPERFALYSLEAQSFVYGGSPDLDAPRDFGDQGYVLLAFGSELLLDEHEDTEMMAVELASALQDLVIDQLGTGWPEHQGSGTVLSPALVNQRATWSAQRRVVAEVGALKSLIGPEA